MVVPHAIEDLGRHARNVLEQIVTGRRVKPHDRVFSGVERSRLVQDRERNTGLADVVERGRDPEPRHVDAGKSDFDSKTHGNAGDQQAVLKGALVIASHLFEERRQPAALDTIDDLRRGARGVRQTDRLAGPRRREHRRECRCAIGQRRRDRQVALSRLPGVLDTRKPEGDFIGRGNHSRGSERTGLRSHRTGLIVDDKQLVAGDAHARHDAPDLLDTRSLPEIHIHHQHAIRTDFSVAISEHAGDDLMPRLERCANGRQLRRFVRDEVDLHGRISVVDSRDRAGKCRPVQPSQRRSAVLPGSRSFEKQTSYPNDESYLAVKLRTRINTCPFCMPRRAMRGVDHMLPTERPAPA